MKLKKKRISITLEKIIYLKYLNNEKCLSFHSPNSDTYPYVSESN